MLTIVVLSDTHGGHERVAVPDGDVLIHAGDNAGVLDRTSSGLDVGDRVLRELVLRLRPRVHAFGHVHEAYGSRTGTGELEGITFLNAAVYNGGQPHVVRLEVPQ